MFTVAVIGYLSISFAITYLFFRFISKSRHPHKTLFSYTFCSTLVFGLLCLAISGPYLDTGIQEKLDRALAANTTLSSENKELKAEETKLKKDITNLKSEVAAHKAKIKALENDNKEMTSNETSLNDQLNELTANNATLQTEVQDLKEKLSNISALTSTSSN